MESILQTHNYARNCWVEFNTFTFMDVALNWWNTNIKNLGVDATYLIPWEEMKRMIVAEFYPMGKVSRMEQGLRHLTRKGQMCLHNQYVSRTLPPYV